MDTLQARFTQAVKDSKELPDKPDSMTLLQIYALYKQATQGDVEGPRPPMSDLVARAKWDAWNEMRGRAPELAKQGYIDLLESLK